MNGHIPNCPCVKCRARRAAVDDVDRAMAQDFQREADRFARIIEDEERKEKRRAAKERGELIASVIVFCIVTPFVAGGCWLGWSQTDGAAWPLRLVATTFLGFVGLAISGGVLRGIAALLQEHGV